MLLNGIDLLALRFNSIIYGVFSFTTNCTLNGPLIFSSLAIFNTFSLILFTLFSDNFLKGIDMVASPLWTPASSICSNVIPNTLFPSETPSISASIAFSMYFEITTGYLGEISVALLTYS
uniref:Uncharacterized protein ORF-c08_008 n=1 Tax=Saccharolobus solfataricus TaxID=2287 RepID=Q9UX34_SACSO|nr:hypothetical protein [Saccharolobus solfataricus P2]